MKRKKIRPKLTNDLTASASEWKWPRVGLFIPRGETIPGACFPAHQRFQAYHRLPQIDTGRSCQLDMTRTRAAEAFMRADGMTHLLMLDADHAHPIDLLPRLARHLSAEVEIVAGMNYSRGAPHKPCCFLDGETPWNGADDQNLRTPATWEPGLMPVAIAGTGAILIARTALEKLDRPFFSMPQWIDPTAKIAWPGEDVGFAANCRRNGVQQYIDTEATSPHLAERWITAADFDPEALTV